MALKGQRKRNMNGKSISKAKEQNETKTNEKQMNEEGKTVQTKIIG